MSNQSKANKLLEGMLGVEQLQEKPQGLRGILQTKNYSDFIILSDGGDEIHRFSGAKLANKCLPGDHVFWNEGKCHLELHDSHPPIVGTVELVNKSKYGLTSRGIPIYLFTPYNKSYPHFIVGCSEKDVSKNRIGLINFDNWSSTSTFPRGQLQQLLGVSGDFEADEVDIEIRQQDLRIDVYRSSGPGGQSVNTTDSAVRITHIPTGVVVSCQNEKSQLQNKESAMRILRARLLAHAQEQADAQAMAERKSQVRTVDRSERIRTYNFPENRLSDHRVNFKSNNLDAVLNGDLDSVIEALLEADKTAKLASGER